MAAFDIADLKRRMQGAQGVLKNELAGLRTGRATPSLVEPITVEAYGSNMPLSQVATVAIPEPRLISIQVWDKSVVTAVEKAIRDSNLGLNPNTEGQVIRLRIPDLNEERRKELVKVAHKYAEAAKVSIRHVRRDGIDLLKKPRRTGTSRKTRPSATKRMCRRRPTRRLPKSIRCWRTRKRKSCRSDGKQRCRTPTPRHRKMPALPRLRRMSRSSWTATDAGPRRAACRAARVIAAASKRCATS